MEQHIQATHVCNIIIYLLLLPEVEQLDELNTISAFIKKKQRKYNKGIEYNPQYIKPLKGVLHLTFIKLQ